MLFFAFCSVHLDAQGTNRINGLKGIDSLSISRVWSTSLVVPGYAQAYNRQYWKIPVIYGGAIALLYGGAHNHSRYKETGNDNYLNQMRFFYAGAGLMYIGAALDGVMSYKTTQEVIPAKATILSTMIPGLGQAYNREYWKIPIIYGGFAFLGYWYDLNQMQYTRFRTAYNKQAAYQLDSSLEPSEFNGRLGLDAIRNQRNAFRRSRDYAVLYLALWYGLNVIDANVFAHLSNFDVGEDLALQVSPALMTPTMYASTSPCIGLTLKVNFKK